MSLAEAISEVLDQLLRLRTRPVGIGQVGARLQDLL